MAQWRRAVAIDGFRTIYKFVYRNRQIAIYRLADGIFATDNVCSHEYSELCEGMIVDENVYCPKHGSRFNIRTGAVIDPPAIRGIRIFSVKVEDGFVYVKC